MSVIGSRSDIRIKTNVVYAKPSGQDAGIYLIDGDEYHSADVCGRTRGPFKCPDCGVWWAGFEHRCRSETTTTTITGKVTVGSTVTCTCPKYPPNYIGDVLTDPNCPVHRNGWTFTGNTSGWPA